MGEDGDGLEIDSSLLFSFSPNAIKQWIYRDRDDGGKESARVRAAIIWDEARRKDANLCRFSTVRLSIHSILIPSLSNTNTNKCVQI
jgi:hypothetical protein